MLYAVIAAGLLAAALWGAGIGKLNRRGDIFRLASLAVASLAGTAAAFTWIEDVAVAGVLVLTFIPAWYLFLYQSYRAEKSYRDLRDSHRPHH